MSQPFVDSLSHVAGSCHICGDLGANYHYNGYSCQSCRVFFTRALLRGKPFSCQYDQKCIINKATRTSCPACRFKKCQAANMETSEVGRYKRQGTAVVHYYSKHQISSYVRKFTQPTSLGFQFVKELDEINPATKFADILISLERMCIEGPQVKISEMKYNMNVSLADALLNSQCCTSRTAARIFQLLAKSFQVLWNQPVHVNNMTDLVVYHYARSVTYLSDFMNAAPEVHKLPISDRLKLARFNFVDSVLLTMIYRMWEGDIRTGLLFFNGIHFEPAMDSTSNEIVNGICLNVINNMRDHVVQTFDEFEISEHEFMVLRMIVLFQLPYDISDEGREIVRQAHDRYCRIMMELIGEKYQDLKMAERFQRFTHILGTISYLKKSSSQVNQLLSMMTVNDIGKMSGSLPFDMHFRDF